MLGLTGLGELDFAPDAIVPGAYTPGGLPRTVGFNWSGDFVASTDMLGQLNEQTARPVDAASASVGDMFPTFLSTEGGSIDPAGDLTKRPISFRDGATGSSAVIVRNPIKQLLAAQGGTGGLTEVINRVLSLLASVDPSAPTPLFQLTRDVGHASTPTTGLFFWLVSRGRGGSVDQSATLSSALAKSFTGLINSVGVLTRFLSRSLSAVQTSVGLSPNTIRRQVQGTADSAGTATNLRAGVFTGSMEIGDTPQYPDTIALLGETRWSVKLMAGNVSFARVYLRSGEVTPSGSKIIQWFGSPFLAAAQPTGITNKVSTRRMLGSATSNGILKRIAKPVLKSAINMAGVLLKGRAFVGGVTSSSLVNHRVTRTFTGLTRPVGLKLVQLTRHLAGTVNSSAIVLLGRDLIATVTSAGQQTFKLAKTFVASSAPASILWRKIPVRLSGVGDQTGRVIWQFSRIVSKVLTPVGRVLTSLPRLLSGMVDSVGLARLITRRSLTGSSQPVAVLAERIFHQLTATVGLINGTIHRLLQTTRSGATQPVGSYRWVMARLLQGAENSLASVSRSIRRSLVGLAASQGNFSRRLVLFRSFTGSVNITGTVTHLFGVVQLLTGQVLSASLVRVKIMKLVSGTQSSVGVETRISRRFFYGLLNSSGTRQAQTLHPLLAQSLAHGIKQANVQRTVTGVSVPVGAKVTRINRQTGGVVGNAGLLSRQLIHQLLAFVRSFALVQRHLDRTLFAAVDSTAILQLRLQLSLQLQGQLDQAAIVTSHLVHHYQSMADVASQAFVSRASQHNMFGTVSISTRFLKWKVGELTLRGASRVFLAVNSVMRMFMTIRPNEQAVLPIAQATVQVKQATKVNSQDIEPLVRAD